MQPFAIGQRRGDRVDHAVLIRPPAREAPQAVGNALRAEVEILGSFDVLRQTLERIGVDVLYPGLEGETLEAVRAAAVTRMQGALTVRTVPSSSMAPTIVARDGRPVLAVGLPGGVRISTSVMQALVNFIDHGMSPQEMVEAPRVWTQGQDLEIETRVPEAVRAAVAANGHPVLPVSTVGGGMNAVAVGDETTAITAGTVPTSSPPIRTGPSRIDRSRVESVGLRAALQSWIEIGYPDPRRYGCKAAQVAGAHAATELPERTLAEQLTDARYVGYGGAIGEEVDACVRDSESPWLRVMAGGGEHSLADQREVGSLGGVASCHLSSGRSEGRGHRVESSVKTASAQSGESPDPCQRIAHVRLAPAIRREGRRRALFHHQAEVLDRCVLRTRSLFYAGKCR